MLNQLKFPAGINTSHFLAEYWQRKPLYMPGALAGFTDPISPDELAGFACEEGISSRIVIEQTNNGVSSWELRHGPFEPDTFSDLPKTHWCVLVQDVNRYIGELNLLLDRFAFLPDWRIDDVMVSYAEAFGTVGPHVDNYDVFLLQGLGTRRWQISESDQNRLLPDCDLRILENFVPQQEFILTPGDVLYLPPGVQHYGVSDRPCMTYSIGFRAPEQFELLGHYIDYCILEQSDRHVKRYRDHALDGMHGCGEITPESLTNIQQLLQNIPTDAEAIGGWFGRFITASVQSAEFIPLHAEDNEIESFLNEIKQQAYLYRDSESRFAYINHLDGVELFVNGASERLSGELASLVCFLCDQRAYDTEKLNVWLDKHECLSLLAAWWQYEWLFFADIE